MFSCPLSMFDVKVPKILKTKYIKKLGALYVYYACIFAGLIKHGDTIIIPEIIYTPKCHDVMTNCIFVHSCKISQFYKCMLMHAMKLQFHE